MGLAVITGKSKTVSRLELNCIKNGGIRPSLLQYWVTQQIWLSKLFGYRLISKKYPCLGEFNVKNGLKKLFGKDVV